MSSRLQYDLNHLVTDWDRKQAAKAAKSARGYYNPNALGLYLIRVSDVVENVAAGVSVQAAVTAGFNDRLRDHILKGLGYPKHA